MTNHKKGFTLVELLVVVSVIGILAAISLVVINPATMQGKARDGKRRTDIKTIQGSIELFYSEHRHYPASTEKPTFGSNWTISSVTYMNNTPQDPKSGWTYCYEQLNGGTGYKLCAPVENSGNATPAATFCTGYPAQTGNSGFFCVTNPF